MKTTLPLVDGALLVDNSFIERLITCPRALQYDRLLKRKPATDQPALSFGTAIHAALEYRYKNCESNPVSPAQADAQRNILVEHFAKSPAAEGDHRTLDFAVEMITRYNAVYHIEPFNLIADEHGKVMAENSFALPLFTYKDIPVVYTGRIDLPVMWEGQLFVMDHKTTTMLGDHYFDGQRVSPQYEGYAWAFEQLTGQRVAGFCINAIRTKAMPAKPRGSWDAWWAEGFARHKEYLKPGQIDEWKRNVIHLIKELFFHLEQDYLPMKKKACTLYGKCPYYEVCYSREDAREAELRSDKFIDNDWSPLK
jgi:hypothetical protein